MIWILSELKKGNIVMALNLDVLLINIVISTIISAPALWLVGRAIVGGEKAKFLDAVWIAALGTVIGTMFGVYFTGIIAAVVQFIIWLALVRHFFDATWSQALITAILNVVVWIIITFILSLIGLAIFRFI